MKSVIVLMGLSLCSTPLLAMKACDELKSEIVTKLDAKGVKNYSLDIVANDGVGAQKVVGSCQGGTHKIVYARNAVVTQEPQVQ